MRQEKKKQMVEELKANGFNSKQVSVSARRATYSSSFNVTVRDPKISIQKIKDIVKKYDKYETDASGDILSGGNDFVFVNRADGVQPAAPEDIEFETVLEMVKTVRTMDDRSGHAIGHYFIMNENWAIELSADYQDGIYFHHRADKSLKDEDIAKTFFRIISENELDRAYFQSKKQKEAK